MSFFELEWFTGMQFLRTGGQGFNTAIVGVQSGQETRNRAWANPRAEYSGSIITPASQNATRQGFIDDLRAFFLMVGGQADGFRFLDQTDCLATNEPMVLVSGSIWQLQKTYSLGGRTYVRTITKPITTSVKDFEGNALLNSVVITSGATGPTVDHTTGQITFASVSGTPHASFVYHIPVRFTSDKFEPENQESDGGKIIKLTLGLIEVRPPNY